ncbi:hypothetical protein ACHAWO_004006 [Cyclotella atomus]|uniref:Phosphoenolpyruvate synthase n=1 Tax=Cyclotella atomus TaxID=382360 RepID=A0ABD3NGD3_9STRA
MMLVHLNTAHPTAANSKAVGGKAASLSRLYKIPSLQNHAPKSYALSTVFFQPWLDILTASADYMECQREDLPTVSLEVECNKLKEECSKILMNPDQEKALKDISTIIEKEFNHGLAAVRSSAIEEDGSDHSFAGIFQTILGVTASNLETAVRECFASKFDTRVFQYSKSKKAEGIREIGFAVVVMEMVNSVFAGVAFSANPLNSDRDECVIDSSWGLGESVVDGSVTADRFIYGKVNKKIIQQTMGHKPTEKRLDLINGSVKLLTVDKKRADECSLPAKAMDELVMLVCDVEQKYEVPIDVEWAITETNTLVLLQARPITTLYWLDENMMSEPGEQRTLYYDFNIASEATTTTPFTHMDLKLYNKLGNAMIGLPDDMNWISDDPKMPVFNASTRQYYNLSIFFKFFSPQYFAKESLVLDPYLSSLYASKDCNRKRYRAKKLPKGVNLCGAVQLIRQVPVLKLYRISRRAKKNPEAEKMKYLALVKEDMAKVKALEERGRGDSGIMKYANELLSCMEQSLIQELGIIMFSLLGLFRELDNKRQFGKSHDDRMEYEALCQGYEGDALMELNIAMYRLANKLDESIWKQYSHERLPDLAERIQKNLDGVASDLPGDFISEWKQFMEEHGYDGEDQLFISSPRYQDTPVLLLARLRQNVGSHANDPSILLRENVSKRKEVQQLQAERAKSNCLSIGYSKVLKRNEILDHLMWIRNAPKLRVSRVYAIIRTAVLKIEQDFIKENRLSDLGDIFHLNPSELDAALTNDSMDLMSLVAPRKAIHERALKATECPLLIDSRCRILRADPPGTANIEDGIFVGLAVAPGVATGRVRILKSPTDQFEQGEVLATTVTSPAWTPLFIGAAGIILQIGGVLQHGALCAREYGKPAVSNIDVQNLLKSGMMVTVDGNKGTVTILEEN